VGRNAPRKTFYTRKRQCVAVRCSVLQYVVVRVSNCSEKRSIMTPPPRGCLLIHMHSSVCVALCCSVIQCVAVYYSVRCIVLQQLTNACWSRDYPAQPQIVSALLAALAPAVLQYVAVCCNALQCVSMYCSNVASHACILCSICIFSALQQKIFSALLVIRICGAAMCCSVLQCAAVCCSVLQCVAVCCSTVTSNACLSSYMSIFVVVLAAFEPVVFIHTEYTYIYIHTLLYIHIICVWNKYIYI